MMIRYKEIAFVAYPVTDIACARQFYEGVLNLKPNAPLQSEPPHWIEYDIGSGTLGIGSSPQWLPSQDGASVALEVEDFDAAVANLREHNVPPHRRTDGNARLPYGDRARPGWEQADSSPA